MVQKHSRRVRILLCGLLVVGMLMPAVGRSQTSEPLQHVEKRLADKQAAAEAHRKQMESITDPNQLATAMQQHFQMTEEILALMLERRKLMAAHAPMGSTSSGSGSGMQSGGMQGQGMMEHGMGMMQKEMGGMQGSAQSGGMQGMGMMQKDMGGMQGSSPQGSGMPCGSMPGRGTPGHTTPSAPSSQTAPDNDMEHMMQQMAKHLAYMETIKDQPLLAQEMLRHQKMVDQMLQLMQ